MMNQGVIRRRLRRPLAKKIFSGEFKDHDGIEVSIVDYELVLKKL